jgi:hypothetical protein
MRVLNSHSTTKPPLEEGILAQVQDTEVLLRVIREGRHNGATLSYHVNHVLWICKDRTTTRSPCCLEIRQMLRMTEIQMPLQCYAGPFGLAFHSAHKESAQQERTQAKQQQYNSSSTPAIQWSFKAVFHLFFSQQANGACWHPGMMAIHRSVTLD